MAHVIRILVFFVAMAIGLWGFATLPDPWGWLAMVVAFVIGGSASMLLFKRFATKQQVKDDLEARLHND